MRYRGVYPAIPAVLGAASVLFLWPQLLTALLSSDFLPHAQCYLWMPSLMTLHLVTDLAIGTAYVAISLTLIYFVRKRVDLPFNRMFVAFGLFIVACGATHFMEVWTLWQPVYWLAGGVKVVTAVASVVTALLLPPLIPKALALPSPRALSRANTELAIEVAERRAAEAKLRTLIESAPDGIVIVDGAGRVEFASRQAERLFGYDRSALVGQPLQAVVPRAGVLEGLTDTTLVELTAHRRDGERLTVEVGASPVPGDEATLVLVVRDVGERRRLESERADRVRAEVARAQAEEVGRRASFLAEASRVVAGSLDDAATLKSMARVAVPYLADYVVVDVLDADLRLRRLGVAHADPAVEPALTAVPPFAFEAGADGPLASVIEGGEATLVREVGEEWLTARARDARHLACHALHPTSLMLVPLRARGRALGVVCFALTRPDRRYTLADLAVAEDLAQRAALAADNARLFREAQDASRAKDEFLAVLSHELRTPLTPVLGWVRMLRSGMLSPAATSHALETVERNTRLQVQLVEDLLDVSRVITGKLHLAIRPVALGLVLEDATESVAAAAAQKSIAITRGVAPDTPLIEADPNRLQQVLANLLSNAVKFTPDGGRVDVSVVRAGAQVRIAVRDTGEGLPPEVAPHIFEPFRQADSTITRQYGGLGLGLAIVRHIVELHGGTVQASSEGPGRGTTMTVLLPVALPAALGGIPSVRAHPRAPASLKGSLRGLRVLVVDDETDARELLATMLELADADVTVVGSAEDALAVLAARPPDVLLSDLAMPRRDGYELMREVRARGIAEDMVAIAVTAQARPEDREHALAAGFQAHVVKPVDPDALAAVVRELVGRSRPS